MTYLQKVTAVATIFLSSWAQAATPGLQAISSREHQFVLRAAPQFKGAHVSVFSASGQLVLAQQLSKRRMLIDFKLVAAGTYLIRVRKGEMEEVFEFTKI